MGTVASAGAMAMLFDHGAGVNRAYYGTDTRAQALMIGAVVAVVLARGAPERTEHQRNPISAWFRPLPALLAGAMALGVLGWMVVSATNANDQAPNWMFYGGFAAAALAAAILVVSVVTAQGCLWARALSLRPARYVGKISYGLYL